MSSHIRDGLEICQVLTIVLSGFKTSDQFNSLPDSGEADSDEAHSYEAGCDEDESDTNEAQKGS